LNKGVDAVYCTSVNDPFVMDAFSNFLNASGKITMLADNGEFAKALGLTIDVPQIFLGLRSARYAMIVDDGVISYLGVDSKGLDKSSFEAVLEKL
jgi:glutaredoxin/glutathione-dependent peroxiredoxin